MPSDDKDIEDLASSADPALDATEPLETPALDDAVSSPATGEDGDMLSVVRDVVSDKRTEPEAASPAEGEEEEPADAGDTGKAKDDEDYSDVPFHKHPRFQQRLRQPKALKVDAERYNNVQNFIDQHGLTADEAADGLVIFGLMKTNPAEAWKRAKPTIQKLLIAAGEVLPDDLRDRVQKGEMSQDAALEVSRSRASLQSVQATRSFEEQRAQQRSQQEAVRSLASAAETWEADRRRKDPTFDAKLEPLMDKVYALQRQEGIPNTPEGVRDQLNRAYKGLVAAAPKPAIVPPKPVTPVRGGQVAGNQTPEPQSYLDVVRANRRSS